MWECPNCFEKEEDKFDVCRNCGMSKDGTFMQPVSDKAKEIEDDEEKNEFSGLPGETVIETDFPGLVLTTHRISYRESTRLGGELNILTLNEQFTSMMLEEVASCVVSEGGKTILILLSIVSFLVVTAVTVLLEVDNLMIPGGIVSLLCLLTYLFTRYHFLEIASARATIQIRATKSGAQDYYDLIDLIEEAKNARYLLGQKT